LQLELALPQTEKELSVRSWNSKPFCNETKRDGAREKREQNSASTPPQLPTPQKPKIENKKNYPPTQKPKNWGKKKKKKKTHWEFVWCSIFIILILLSLFSYDHVTYLVALFSFSCVFGGVIFCWGF
jgi:hypothetical protein